MSRGVVRMLALVRMMASVVNAQCAVSCASLAPAETTSVAQVFVHQKDHACCPRHGSPKTQETPAMPCGQTTPHADAVRLEIHDAATIVLPAAAAVEFG